MVENRCGVFMTGAVIACTHTHTHTRLHARTLTRLRSKSLIHGVLLIPPPRIKHYVTSRTDKTATDFSSLPSDSKPKRSLGGSQDSGLRSTFKAEGCDLCYISNKRDNLWDLKHADDSVT